MEEQQMWTNLNTFYFLLNRPTDKCLQYDRSNKLKLKIKKHTNKKPP